MRPVSVHEDEGYRSGILVAEGPKWIQVIWPDSSGVKITRLANDRHLKITEMPDYPINRAKKILRRCGKAFGITKSARKALRK